MDVQICVSVSQFQNRTSELSCGSIVFASAIVSALSLYLQEGLGVGPLPQLFLELPRLVDHDLAVIGQDDAGPAPAAAAPAPRS